MRQTRTLIRIGLLLLTCLSALPIRALQYGNPYRRPNNEIRQVVWVINNRVGEERMQPAWGSRYEQSSSINVFQRDMAIDPYANATLSSVFSYQLASQSLAQSNLQDCDNLTNATLRLWGLDLTDGDENLKPGYDPEDPFKTPVGDIPWLLMALLAIAYTTRIGYKLQTKKDSSSF